MPGLTWHFKAMTKEKLEEVKKRYISHIKNYVVGAGSLFPHISILGTHKDDEDKSAIIHIPIPGKFMEADSKKDEFLDDILPEIAKKVRENFNIGAVAWAAEAWMRTMGKDEYIPGVTDYKTLPIKKEVIILTFESADDHQAMIFELKRLGKKVNEEGELIDQIELYEQPELSSGSPTSVGGRFTGLYKRITDLPEDSN